jgi:transposase-like protein
MTKPLARDPIYRRRAFDADIIELCVRWYITHRLSYRDLVEMMAERGVTVSHTTILRWVTRYVPKFEKPWNRYSRPVGTSWRVDETYIAIRAKWHYLYRAVDKHRKTVDFLLRLDRGIAAAQAFFCKALRLHLPRWPRKVTLDGHVPSHRAVRLLRRGAYVAERRGSGLQVSQQHHRAGSRAIKRRCAPMKDFKSFANAAIAIAGIELTHRIHKRQYHRGARRLRKVERAASPGATYLAKRTSLPRIRPGSDGRNLAS